MRQIKNYLRSKRTMWNCQESACATLNAWKCMNEFCGCGEGGSAPEPTVVDVETITLAESIDLVMGEPTSYSTAYTPANADAEGQISFGRGEGGICNLDSISYSEGVITIMLTPQSAGTDSLIVYLRGIEYGSITINVEPETTDFTLTVAPNDGNSIVVDNMTGNTVTFPVSVTAGQRLTFSVPQEGYGTSVMLQEENAESDTGWVGIAEYQIKTVDNQYPDICYWFLNGEPWPTTEYVGEDETYNVLEDVIVDGNIEITVEANYGGGE